MPGMMNELAAARTDLACAQCGAPMVLRSSRFGPFYGCSTWPRCDGTHGAHPDGAPLGTPADAKTKRARESVHEVFDPLWRDATQLYEVPERPRKARKQAIWRIQRRARTRTYAWLAQALELPVAECHIGLFDEGTCLRAHALCFNMKPVAIRDWAKERNL